MVGGEKRTLRRHAVDRHNHEFVAHTRGRGSADKPKIVLIVSDYFGFKATLAPVAVDRGTRHANTANSTASQTKG